MKLTPQEERITALVAPIVEEQGHKLVCVKVTGGGADKETIVQIMAENPDTRNLGVDDAAKISREISALMDVEDPVSSAYRLEVSSPGIDRPLVRFEDYVDFSGLEIKIEIAPPINGQKRFRGYITEAKDNVIRLKSAEDEEFEFDFTVIQKAKLVMNDELLEKSKQWVKKRI